MVVQNIIVIGGSAGGVEASKKIISALPADFPAAIFVVIHFPTNAKSFLPGILNRAGALPSTHANDGEKIELGHIYVAPPDRHLQLAKDTIRVIYGPKENRFRPAIDPLFKTAARTYQGKVIGVLLSGTGDDGTLGLQAVKSNGGIAIAQNPADALYGDMPQNAIDKIAVDYVLPVNQIPLKLVEIIKDRERVNSLINIPMDGGEDDGDVELVRQDVKFLEENGRDRQPSMLTCPDCGGVLWELNDKHLRYRCHVGHSYSLESMLAAQSDDLEASLWVAVRTLEERAALIRRLSKVAKAQGRHLSADRFDKQVSKIEYRADLIRRIIPASLSETSELEDKEEVKSDL